jgi:hypothetical protein
LLFLYKDFYRCSLCGEEVEQYINGVIKYIPITNSKRIGLMTETVQNMSSEFKLSDQTNVSLPIKNIVAIISAIVVAVWTYFGIVERLNRLETNEKLMAQDLLKKAEQTPKNQEMYMLIEYQAKSIDKHSKQLEENVHTKVLIAQLEKKVDKLEKELDAIRGK